MWNLLNQIVALIVALMSITLMSLIVVAFLLRIIKGDPSRKRWRGVAKAMQASSEGVGHFSKEVGTLAWKFHLSRGDDPGERDLCQWSADYRAVAPKLQVLPRHVYLHAVNTAQDRYLDQSQSAIDPFARFRRMFSAPDVHASGPIAVDPSLRPLPLDAMQNKAFAQHWVILTQHEREARAVFDERWQADWVATAATISATGEAQANPLGDLSFSITNYHCRIAAHQCNAYLSPECAAAFAAFALATVERWVPGVTRATGAEDAAMAWLSEHLRFTASDR